MKLIKKLQILLLKNIKIIISILLIISLSSIIFYLDLFNLNFLNKQDIIDLKMELLEEKYDLNSEEKEKLNSEKTPNNKNLYKYLIVASCIILFVLSIYYNSGDNQFDADVTTLNKIENSKFSEDDILFHEIAEINALNAIKDEASIKSALSLNMFLQESFIDEAAQLRTQLEELAKK